MIDFARALQTILRNTQALHDEKVGVSQSHLRVLSGDIVAPANLPAWDNSAMDGFAVRTKDIVRASTKCPVVLRVCGESRAGSPFMKRVKVGEAVRVMTGGVIPDGANAVIPVEETTIPGKKKVSIPARVAAGAYIRKAGEDVGKGGKAIASGTLIQAPHIGLLDAFGYRKVRVSRRPVVSIIATGDELVEPGERLAYGKIYNSTSHALAAYVEKLGGIVQSQRVVGDGKKALRRSVRKSLEADILVLTGGVSKGLYDIVADVLASCGVEGIFHGVNIKPGKPLFFGRKGKTLVFGLPGNPVSTCVTFLQFIRPAMLRMSGCRTVALKKFHAMMSEGYRKKDTKRHFVRGVCHVLPTGLSVGIAGNQSSGAISSLVKANCLIVVPEDAHELRRGDSVEIEMLDMYGFN